MLPQWEKKKINLDFSAASPSCRTVTCSVHHLFLTTHCLLSSRFATCSETQLTKRKTEVFSPVNACKRHCDLQCFNACMHLPTFVLGVNSVSYSCYIATCCGRGFVCVYISIKLLFSFSLLLYFRSQHKQTNISNTHSYEPSSYITMFFPSQKHAIIKLVLWNKYRPIYPDHIQFHPYSL